MGGAKGVALMIHLEYCKIKDIPSVKVSHKGVIIQQFLYLLKTFTLKILIWGTIELNKE